MKWMRLPESLDYLLMVLFGLFYLAYLYRNWQVGRRLGSQARSTWIKFLLRSGYFTLLILALMGPTFGETTQEIRSVGKDILVCLDLSRSMNAPDIAPTRLEKAKLFLQRLSQRFPNDRLGLLIFAREAWLQCPLTTDTEAFTLFLQSLNTDLVPAGAAHFGPALALAAEKLPANGSELSRPAQVILLISDGDDADEQTPAAVSTLQSRQIPIYTLGIGTYEGSTLRENGRIVHDENGEDLITRLQAQELKYLSSRTQGEYFEISEQADGQSALLEALAHREGTIRQVRTQDVAANKYYYFLFVAFVLMVGDVLFTIQVVKL